MAGVAIVTHLGTADLKKSIRDSVVGAQLEVNGALLSANGGDQQGKLTMLISVTEN